MEGLGYSQKTFNPKFEVLSKKTDPSSSSSTHRGLKSYFAPTAENAKVLTQIEPKVVESKVLKKLEPKALKSKVMKNQEPKMA